MIEEENDEEKLGMEEQEIDDEMEEEEQRPKLKRKLSLPEKWLYKLRRSARIPQKRRCGEQAKQEQEDEEQAVRETVNLIVKEKFESRAESSRSIAS
eukprot:7584498-Heterocapsa_arctica.AAC.1